jgi:hypothetical protein
MVTFLAVKFCFLFIILASSIVISGGVIFSMVSELLYTYVRKVNLTSIPSTIRK